MTSLFPVARTPSITGSSSNHVPVIFAVSFMIGTPLLFPGEDFNFQAVGENAVGFVVGLHIARDEDGDVAVFFGDGFHREALLPFEHVLDDFFQVVAVDINRGRAGRVGAEAVLVAGVGVFADEHGSGFEGVGFGGDGFGVHGFDLSVLAEGFFSLSLTFFILLHPALKCKPLSRQCEVDYIKCFGKRGSDSTPPHPAFARNLPAAAPRDARKPPKI